MKYLSVCSGIEAASVAWKDLGWKAEAFSEIEPFPSAVLQHHYKETPNLGDMTKYESWNINTIDLLVGGTPCQSFSVAGLRQGLKDPRGNLMLTYLAIADRYRPKWLLWENVPGVLSSNSGRDFGTFLGALVELGYGFAYRVLDAQWFGVAQRRRRVFVVGCLGDERSAAKVLFESESLQRHPAPSREKGKRVADTLTVGANQCSGFQGDFVEVADCLRSGGAGGVPSSRGEHLVTTICRSSGQANAENLNEVSSTLSCLHESPIIATAFEPGIAGREGNESRFTHEVTGTLRKDMGDNQTAVALYENHPSDSRITGPHEVSPSCRSRFGSGGGNLPLVHSTAVRRLTPTECERLQGFSDGYTNIPWRKKPESPDGPRYKALGNSMAVPVMRWLGERIDKVNKEQA